jgi:hypothetical protein
MAGWLFARTPAFACYPTLGRPTAAGALLVALVCAGLLAAALIVVERCSRS